MVMLMPLQVYATRMAICSVLPWTALSKVCLSELITEWNIETGQCLFVYVGHTQWIKSLQVSGNYLISGGWEETIHLWDLQKQSLFKRVFLNMGPISNIQVNNSKITVSCREDGFQHQLCVLDFANEVVDICLV